jgi:hypothetical protein
MTIDAQGSLFGEGRMTAPQRSSEPDFEAIRGRLNRLIETLRTASTMPFSERDARMWRTVVPNMTKWLPDAEAEAVRMAFATEMERLAASE